jgi:hypothetical protein
VTLLRGRLRDRVHGLLHGLLHGRLAGRRTGRVRGRLVAVVLVASLLAALGSLTASAPSARADSGYPSWNDVQAAKASQASTRAEVTKIDALLAGLQTAANRASVEAIIRAAENAAALAKLASATQTANGLTAELIRAAASADELTRRSGQLTEQLVRFGGPAPALGLLLSEKSPANLLYQLGAVSQLTAQASSLVAAARAQRNLAGSLKAQAEAARGVRDSLARKAAATLAAAQAAQQRADAELATQQANGRVLYAQLASLKNTTAAIEKKYAQGVAAQEAYNASHGSGTGGADSFAPPPGVTVDPAAAQSYASGAIGAYGWGGDQMTCLVWLWNRESGWRADAYNTSSGSYGIPQSLPADKMSSAGSDWATNANTQINWGLGYISSRYGSPCAAWTHEMSNNWY